MDRLRGRKRSVADACGPAYLVTPRQDPILRHPFNWERISMAAALAYRWDGARTRLYFQTREGTYNEESLIEFVRDLRRHFRGQQVILLWDGLPSHRSKLMTQFLAEQRTGSR